MGCATKAIHDAAKAAEESVHDTDKHIASISEKAETALLLLSIGLVFLVILLAMWVWEKRPWRKR